MNLDLYSDEFRDFKFLQSSPEDVKYYKTARAAADIIQPWDLPHDPNFHWNTRIEFIEQLIDLRNDSVYLVFAGLISSRNEYEDANLITIENPIVLNGNPIIQKEFFEIKIEDIPSTDFLRSGFSVVEAKYLVLNKFDTNGRIFNLNNLPIIPFSKTDFTELFYDRAEAEQYRQALTDMIRKKFNAISSFADHL